jgi:hypothetical protein
MGNINFDDRLYNKSIFMTTHNSYRWSLKRQLDHGIRGFELDIHDVWTIIERIKRFFTRIKLLRSKGNFKIGHWYPGEDVSHKKDGNPSGNNLEDWLRVINDWSKNNPNHAPITVFIDIKRDLTNFNNRPHKNFGLIRLNEQISNAFEHNKGAKNTAKRLYTFDEYSEQFGGTETPEISWPTIGELRGKIIVVLMSFHFFPEPLGNVYGVRIMHNRQTYQEGIIDSLKIEPTCFVAFNPDDRGKRNFNPSLEKDSMYVTAITKYSDEFQSFWNQGKTVRTDYNPEPDWPPLPPHLNFPATDKWDDSDYKNATDKWVI